MEMPRWVHYCIVAITFLLSLSLFATRAEVNQTKADSMQTFAKISDLKDFYAAEANRFNGMEYRIEERLNRIEDILIKRSLEKSDNPPPKSI